MNGLAGKLRGVFADTRPLQTPDFRRLWVANIVTVIGAQLTVVAVPASPCAIRATRPGSVQAGTRSA